jgi:hypothetical protein
MDHDQHGAIHRLGLIITLLCTAFTGLVCAGLGIIIWRLW